MHEQYYSRAGLGLLLRLNWDRALSAFAIALALLAGTWAASI